MNVSGQGDEFEVRTLFDVLRPRDFVYPVVPHVAPLQLTMDYFGTFGKIFQHFIQILESGAVVEHPSTKVP